MLSLPTPDIVRTVTLGENGLAGSRRARIVIDLSTTGPGVATLVAAGLAQHDITYVDAPVSGGIAGARGGTLAVMVRSEEHTSELQSLMRISYAGFCLKKQNNQKQREEVV